MESGVVSVEPNAGLSPAPLILEGTGPMDRNTRLRCSYRGEDRLHRRDGDGPIPLANALLDRG